MIPVWLYESDGRAVACVYVTVPQPASVRWAGRVFHWDSSRGRYMAKSVPQPEPYPYMESSQLPEVTEVPEKDRPSQE